MSLKTEEEALYALKECKKQSNYEILELVPEESKEAVKAAIELKETHEDLINAIVNFSTEYAKLSTMTDVVT
ncbi:MAG: hypothetical protein FWC26_04525 [Fibromonadales bacterium]|nr:hypothetical protein [Fibromonadales bacterium]